MCEGASRSYIHARGKVAVQRADVALKNKVVFGTVNAGRETFEAAIRDLGRFMELWPAAVRTLITGRFPVSAYRDLLLGAPSGIKNVIRFA